MVTKSIYYVHSRCVIGIIGILRDITGEAGDTGGVEQDMEATI